MNAYQLETLSEKLRDERALHGPEVCIDCANGVHEIPGCSWCECACHGLRPAQAGEIQATRFQGVATFSRRAGFQDGVPQSVNEIVSPAGGAKDDTRQAVKWTGGVTRPEGSPFKQSMLEF